MYHHWMAAFHEKYDSLLNMRLESEVESLKGELTI